MKRANTQVKSSIEKRKDNENEPKFKIRKRNKDNILPENAFKILAAPELNAQRNVNILDWSDSKLALALKDTIYLVDPLIKNQEMV